MNQDSQPIRLLDRDLQVLLTGEGVDYRWFWSRFARGDWEIDTLNTIDAASSENDICVDIGGWIGPTALWAAFSFAIVYVFEPDPVALKVLRRNIRANPVLERVITVIPSAAGSFDGDLDLYSAKKGMSETSVFNLVQRGKNLQTFGEKFTVPSVDLVRFIRDLHPNEHRIFLKMDIEGAEFALLPHIAETLEKYGIVMSVTLHPQNIVSTTTDATIASRITSIGKCLAPYASMWWYRAEGRRFIECQKTEILKSLLNNLQTDQTFVISGRKLGGAL